MSNYFETLYKVAVTDHIEKKNGFSYVSWPFAVAELRKRHPAATWEVRRFDGLPYMVTPAGIFVEVAVTVEGITLSQIHPVLDNANRPLKDPTAFHINTSIQRCLVKAIALHGLGLHVYAGEDLPEQDAPTFADHLAALDAAPSMEALKQAFINALRFAGGDAEMQRQFGEAKDKRKTDLTTLKEAA